MTQMLETKPRLREKGPNPLWVVSVNRLIYFCVKITVWLPVLPACVFSGSQKKINDLDTLKWWTRMDLAKHDHRDANAPLASGRLEKNLKSEYQHQLQVAGTSELNLKPSNIEKNIVVSIVQVEVFENW